MCIFWLVIGRIEPLTQDVDAKVETWPTFLRTLGRQRLRKTHTSIYKRSNSFTMVHVPAVDKRLRRTDVNPLIELNCDGGFTSTSQCRVQHYLGSPPLTALFNSRPHRNLTKQPPDLLNVT
jgi:hypothetical protein